VAVSRAVLVGVGSEVGVEVGVTVHAWLRLPSARAMAGGVVVVMIFVD
jgi:hypothetical protein